jgi:hypothetical protein
MTDRHESPALDPRDAETRELLGLFDGPAFVRRGQELEHTLARLQARCRRERDALLEMVRLRLRQWASAAEGPDDWRDTFTGPVSALWAGAGIDPGGWAAHPSSSRRRLAIARDLIASVARFNRRWNAYLSGLDLAPVNDLIDHYNQYYVFEKECVVRSAQLAARHFEPRSHVIRDALLAEYALLPVPVLIQESADAFRSPPPWWGRDRVRGIRSALDSPPHPDPPPQGGRGSEDCNWTASAGSCIRTPDDGGELPR